MTKTVRLSDEAYQKILDESKKREMLIGEIASLRVIRNEFIGEEKSREKEARGEEEEEEEEEEELTEEAKRNIEEFLSLRRKEKEEKTIKAERKEVKKEEEEEEWVCGNCGYEGTGNTPSYCPGCGVEFNL